MTGSVNLALLPPSTAPGAKPPELRADERGFFQRMWGEEGFSFGALLDIVNPLQHIPVVGTIYRAVTGDTIGTAPRIAGGVLFGGVFGLVASIMDSVVESETGKDVGQHLLALSKESEPLDPWRPERDGVLLAGDFTVRETTTGTQLASVDAQAPPQVAASTVEAAATALPPPPLVPARATPAPTRAGGQSDVGNGVGGRSQPLTTARAGRAPINLPSPQALAADPALLRQMQQGRPPRADGGPGLDTAIRPQTSVPAATFLDYAPRNAALRASETRNDERGPDAPRRVENPAADKSATHKPADGAIPTAPPDLLTRMNAALEKYQAMQRGAAAPSLDVSR